MNSYVKQYREFYRQKHGKDDPRSDYALTRMLGDGLRQRGDFDTEKQFPDFLDEYRDIINQSDRSLTEEVGAGLRTGTIGMGATAVGGAALLADLLPGEDGWIDQRIRDPLLRTSQRLSESAAEGGPTIKRVQDVRGPAEAARWLAGAAGQVAPSVAESVGVGLVTGGVGAIASGALKESVKVLSKQAIKRLAARGVTEEIGEKAFQQALRSEIRGLTARTLGTSATLANSYLLNSGEIYTELANDPEVGPEGARNIAAGFGLLAAAPDTFLPGYVLGKFFPKGGASAAETAKAAGFFKRVAKEAAKTAPIEASTESFQELVNIAAGKYSRGEPATLSSNEVDQIVNAGALGLIGGTMASPLAAAPGGRTAEEESTTQPSVDRAERIKQIRSQSSASEAPRQEGGDTAQQELDRINERLRQVREAAMEPQPEPMLTGARTGTGEAPQASTGEKGTQPPSIEVLDEALAAQFTNAGGYIDAGAFADAVYGRAASEIKAGNEVILVVDDGRKRVPIVSVVRGMMTDALGQRWGTLGMLSRGDRVEISPKRSAQAMGPTPTASTQPSVIPSTQEQPREATTKAAVRSQTTFTPESQPAQPPAPSLSELLNLPVSYEGYAGRLLQDAEGNFVVDTGDTQIEVSGSGKDGTRSSADLGLRRLDNRERGVALAQDGSNVRINGRDMRLPKDPRDALNFDNEGNLVSVTLTDPATNQKRTFRDQEAAMLLAEQLAEQDRARRAQVRPANAGLPPPAVEMDSSDPTQQWVADWLKGFDPTVIEFSERLERFGESIPYESPEFAAAFRGRASDLEFAIRNIEEQIRRVETSTLPNEYKTEITDELYNTLADLEQGQLAIQAADGVSTAPAGTTRTQGAAATGADSANGTGLAGRIEPLAAAWSEYEDYAITGRQPDSDGTLGRSDVDGEAASIHNTRVALVLRNPQTGRIHLRGLTNYNTNTGLKRLTMAANARYDIGKGLAVANMARKESRGRGAQRKFSDPNGRDYALIEDLQRVGYEILGKVRFSDDVVLDARAIGRDFNSAEELDATLSATPQKPRKTTTITELAGSNTQAGNRVASGDAAIAVAENNQAGINPGKDSTASMGASPEGLLSAQPNVAFSNDPATEFFLHLIDEGGVVDANSLGNILRSSPASQTFLAEVLTASDNQINTAIERIRNAYRTAKGNPESFSQRIAKATGLEWTGRTPESSSRSGAADTAARSGVEAQPSQPANLRNARTTGTRTRTPAAVSTGQAGSKRPGVQVGGGLPVPGSLTRNLPRDFLVGKTPNKIGGIYGRMIREGAAGSDFQSAFADVWTDNAQELQGWEYTPLLQRVVSAYADVISTEGVLPRSRAGRELFADRMQRYARISDTAVEAILGDQTTLEDVEAGVWVSDNANRLNAQDNYTSVDEAAWGRTLYNLGAAGVDVNLLQQESDSTEAFLRQQNASVSRSRRIINLVMADLTQPNLNNLVSLIHEAAHLEFAVLTVDQRVALFRAADQAVFSLPELALPSNLNASPEEAIVESISRALVAEGFVNNPTSIAQAIVRTIRAVSLRMMMAMQRALLGAEHVSPELAYSYLETRMRQLLGGDAAVMRSSWISRLGGGRATRGMESRYYQQMPGFDIEDFADPTTGRVVQPTVIPDTIDAALYNIENASRGVIVPVELVESLSQKYGLPRMNGEAVDLSVMLQGMARGIADPDARQLAERLSRHSMVKSTAFMVSDDVRMHRQYDAHFSRHQGDSVYGFYSATRDLVMLGEWAFESENRLLATIGHEALHAATAKGIGLAEALKDSGPEFSQPWSEAGIDTEALLDAYGRIDRIFRSLQGNAQFQEFSSAANVHEFVADVFTNPEFIEWAKTQPAPPSWGNMPLWDAIVDAVRRLLGARDGNVLDLSRELVSSLIESTDYADVAYRMEGDTESAGVTFKQAEARIQAAAVRELDASMRRQYEAYIQANPGATVSYEEFFRIVTKGDLPEEIITSLAEFNVGDARLGSLDTAVMEDQAEVAALILKQKAATVSKSRLAGQRETEAKIDERIKKDRGDLNRLEKDYLDANTQNAEGLRAMREQIKDLADDLRELPDLAFATGQLTQTIQQLEKDLADPNVLPEYERVFNSILRGDVRIVDYLQDMANADVDWATVSAREAADAVERAAVRSAKLRTLFEDGKRPLRFALISLARSNARQMATLRMRVEANTEERAALQQDLDEIRSASDERLAQIRENLVTTGKLRSARDQIKREYLKHHAIHRKNTKALEEVRASIRILEPAANGMAKEADTAAAQMGDLKPWEAVDGADYFEMQLDDKGQWKAVTRKLQISAGEPSQTHAPIMYRARSANQKWLRWAEDNGKQNTTLYNAVKDQTQKLQKLTIDKEHQASNTWAITRMLQDIGSRFGGIGSENGKIIERTVRKFSTVMRVEDPEMQKLSRLWSDANKSARKASGYRLNQDFWRDVFNTALFTIENEPGLTGTPLLDRVWEEVSARMNPDRPPAENFRDRLDHLIRTTKTISDYEASLTEKYGARVEDPRVQTIDPLTGESKNLFRRLVKQGWSTTARRFRQDIALFLTQTMQQTGWDDTTGAWTKLKDAGTIEEAAATMQGLFSKTVVDKWLEPFAIKPGRQVFKGADGKIAGAEDISAAWVESGKDPIAFALNLFKRTAGTSIDPEKLSQMSVDFVKSTLQRMRALYQMERKIVEENAQRNPLDRFGKSSSRMLDARTNGLLPPEHLSYDVFDPVSAKYHLAQIAQLTAFGRDNELLDKPLTALMRELDIKGGELKIRGGLDRKRRKELEKELGKERVKELVLAEKRLKEVKDWGKSLQSYFSDRNDMGPYRDLTAMNELISLVTTGAVNNPRTAFLNLVALSDFAVVQKGMNATTAKAMAVAVRSFSNGVFGGITRMLGLDIIKRSETEKILADTFGNLNERGLSWREWFADPGFNARYEQGSNYWEQFLNRGVQGSRLVQRSLTKGFFRTRQVAEAGYIPFTIFGIFDYITSNANIGIATGAVETFQAILSRAIRHFEQNPSSYDDPMFRFKPDELAVGGDSETIGWWMNELADYGMGTIEDMARQSLERRLEGDGSILTIDQVRALGMIAVDQISRESSLSTRPVELFNNQVLKVMSPLLGWPLSKMDQIHKAMRSNDGRLEWKAALKTSGMLAGWSLPIGLAFTLLLDEYDEEVVGKRSNLRDIDSIWALPVAGPLLNLVGVGSRSFSENAMGALERSSRAGNIYGMGMDFVNGILNWTDPRAGQRTLSLDSRVLVMSTFHNFETAMRNLVNQKGYTYESVGRPLVYALGGNSLLQAVQTINNLGGFGENQESRVVLRIDSNIYMRAAGRELGFEIRSGGGSAPTPVSKWMRQMQLAAYAGDRADFLQYYRSAVAEIIKEGTDPQEAERTILTRWKARHPVSSVFRHKLSDNEYAQLLSAMNGRGRNNVTTAVNRFESFTDLLESTVPPAKRGRSSGTRPQTAADIRRQLYGDMMPASSGRQTAEQLRKQLYGGL